MSGLDRDVDDVRRLIEARLGLRGADLSDQIRKCRRALPRKLRQDGRALSIAHQHSQHPHLSRMLDEDAARAAAARLIAHLKGIDPRERRRTALIGWLGAISLNLLIVGAVLVAVLVWRGHV